ncbi:Lysine exporter protein (LYSE/YGGA) [Caenispirillum salinarum AK4]|uniref:Lysine exporter protein (LYSE/YGGA) n=1 Tax=Caenispirillum salinarum AK4 TaxID=1238182 RepID=K9H329_9PROT|nr:LysE family translocator [Caenispirillum salinarum]EKV31987.1 Lysine exporter protein (LYSE/YGGA) [Caenispirillum salinarum AK4]
MGVEFLVTAIVVILVPGTGVLYTLAHGLGRGWRASVLAAVGCTLGILPHIAASIAGLAALLHASALAFQAVKIAGVVYLLFMAWSMLREGGALLVSENREAAPPLRIIGNGIAINVLNPKLSLFFLAFLPQFVPADSTAPTLAMLGLAAVFMLLTFIVFVGYGAFAAATRRHVIGRPAVMRWLRRGFAATFGALGLRLALAER